ncbi:proteasome activator complex subunit 4 [Caerostris extrusa]|uniref:Proteasome activator complex subunit 4 n=1 Tax=Caerostris extrusa TaxID=172846 RepID=A0AAV4WZW6_CAEEX|nr:proteasome activator complex subunit 4 [Caerostris extrusa]
MIKNILENRLLGQKKHIRSLLIDRVLLQHELRISEKYKLYFSSTHEQLMKDLLNLSTSHYSEVRRRAQAVLQNCLYHNGSSYKIILPDMLENLRKDPMICHEQFKGVLYVILGHKQHNLLKIKRLPYYQIKLEITKSCIDAAKSLWNGNQPLPISPCFDDETIQKYSEEVVLKSNVKKQSYLNLVHQLIDIMKKGNLHWRNYLLAFTMLTILLRADVRVPTEGVDLFMSQLVHDTLAIRKLAIQGMMCILKQHKRKHSKIEINPFEQNPKNPVTHHLMPKVDEIPDNFWLQYNSANHPNSEEKWNSRYYVHKTHWGFYSWPKSFKVYANDSEQPKVNRAYEELTEEEKPIYDALAQQKFLDNVIMFLSLEEKKDHDKFDLKKFYMFKQIFANFGDNFCLFLKIICIECGCKHWNFQKIQQLKEYMTPILEKVMNNITPETLNDWATCFATVSTNKDPNKLYWIFEFFMHEPLSIEQGSFLEASWLYLLLSFISQQEWKTFELLHRALHYILPKLDHPYQNVREKLGSFLVCIFMYDIPMNTKSLLYAPKRVPFIKSLMSKISLLEARNNGDENKTVSIEESPELKSAKNLFRTIGRWITVNASKTLLTAPPDILALLPVLCQMVNDTTDTGFQRECQVTIAILGQAFLNSESIDAVIKILKNIASGNSWHSRVTAAAYLQTMVFSNLFTVMNNETWKLEIYDMVLKLLQDENVEVRESAAETLCGFLHCEFFKISDELLNTFKKKCQKKLKKKCTPTGNGPNNFSAEDLRERHAGILGLCSCVHAYPYDVPEFLPDILVLLGDHLHDPQPISTTIKKTLSSFRRTHHDNWRDHKLKFTDDQLAVITDLLVSPSYYA